MAVSYELSDVIRRKLKILMSNIYIPPSFLNEY